MKVAVVYTSTTPELLEMTGSELKKQFAGRDLTVMEYQDPTILQEARDNGGVTPGCTRRLVDLYEKAAKDGADILLSACSSVGDVAKLAKPLYEMMGKKFIRMDEDMASAAVRSHTRIGVVATLPTTLEPTKRLLLDCAKAQGKEVELIDALADGAFGLSQERFKRKLVDTAAAVKDRVDAVLLAQGSMAYAEETISKELGIPVYSSIRFAAAAVRAAADL